MSRLRYTWSSRAGATGLRSGAVLQQKEPPLCFPDSNPLLWSPTGVPLIACSAAEGSRCVRKQKPFLSNCPSTLFPLNFPEVDSEKEQKKEEAEEKKKVESFFSSFIEKMENILFYTNAIPNLYLLSSLCVSRKNKIQLASQIKHLISWPTLRSLWWLWYLPIVARL